MGAGDWIAVYAAGIGSASFIWQWITSTRARTPRLTLGGLLIHFVASVADADALAQSKATGEWPSPGFDFRVQVDVTNVGQIDVPIERVEFRQRVSGGMRVWVAASTDTSDPLVLQAGHGRQFFLTDEDLEGFDAGGVIVAEAVLQSGKRFTSDEFGSSVGGSLVALAGPVFEELVGPERDRFYVQEVHVPRPGHGTPAPG